MSQELLGQITLMHRTHAMLIDPVVGRLVSLKLGGAMTGIVQQSAADDEPKKGLLYTPRKSSRVAGRIAVLPIFGLIDQRINAEMEYFGGTSTEELGRAFDEAVADTSVKAIVLQIDSPGGSSMGTPEMGQRIFSARGSKPIVAIADSYAASAAYWIGVQADKLYVTPSGMVGSIGVYTWHEDDTGFLEQLGVKVTTVKQPRFKAEGLPWEPLTSEYKNWLQEYVDGLYGMFVRAVAQGRGVTELTVRKQFGEGRTMVPAKAKAVGMIDGIKTFDQVIQSLVGKSAASGGRAEGEASGLGLEGKELLAAMCEDLADGATPEPNADVNDDDLLSLEIETREREASLR